MWPPASPRPSMAITGRPVVPALRSSACVCIIASGRGPYPAGLRRRAQAPGAPRSTIRAPMTTIGLLHPGAMGAAVGAALVAAARDVR